MMCAFQSYSLLENGDEPGSSGREVVSSGRKRLQESVQSVRAVFDPPSRSKWTNSTTKPLLRSFNRRSLLVVISALLLVGFVGSSVFGESGLSDPSSDVLQYIDPLIGTGPGGHVFAGATLPFGMAKPVADVAGSERMGGFASVHSPVTGFSSLHDSGTGGSPSLGNFPIDLRPSCPNITTCKLHKSSRYTQYVTGSVKASPGYFAIDLITGIRAEMTADHKTSLFRFSFVNATDVTAPVLLQDGSDLPGGIGNRALAVDPRTGRLTAKGDFTASFGHGKYKNYQCVDFRGPQIQDVGGFNTSNYPERCTWKATVNSLLRDRAYTFVSRR